MRTIRNVSFCLLVLTWLAFPTPARATDGPWSECYGGGGYGLDWGIEYAGLENTSGTQAWCDINDGNDCYDECMVCGRPPAGDSECEFYRYCQFGGCGAGGDTVGCDCDCPCQEEPYEES